MTPFFFQRLDKHNPEVSTGDISLYSYHNQGFIARVAKWIITGTIKAGFLLLVVFQFQVPSEVPIFAWKSIGEAGGSVQSVVN